MTIVSKLIAALAITGASLIAPASAQDFPDRLVRIVVPYPAGGGVDGMARALGEGLSQIWKQTVIIENKPGASTMIGGETVARAPADGYTLLLTSDSSITSNPFLFPKREIRSGEGSGADHPADRTATSSWCCIRRCRPIR